MKSIGRVVLDTNAAIAVLADERAILDTLERASEWLLPVIVLGEMIYGAYASTRVRDNLLRIASFAGLCQLVGVDQDTAQFYGRLRTELRFSGKPIPMNDVWIASLCRQHQASLLSKDRHFRAVESLDIIQW
jgi:tRNA(fMet)-specific endonuclease VapC